MLAKAWIFLRRNPEARAVEQYAITFLATDAVFTLGELEHAAGSHLQFTWPFLASLLVTGARAGYDGVRPLVVASLARRAVRKAAKG